MKRHNGPKAFSSLRTQLGLSFYLLIDSPVFFPETCSQSHFLFRIRVQNLGWKEGAWKSRKSAISFYYHLQMRVGESEMLIMASPLYSKKQYYKIYEIKSKEEGNADCMTLFSEHLPICKEKKGASAAPSKLFWESVRRRKKFFRSVPSLAPFQSTTEFRSEQNINTTLKQVCVSHKRPLCSSTNFSCHISYQMVNLQPQVSNDTLLMKKRRNCLHKSQK